MLQDFAILCPLLELVPELSVCNPAMSSPSQYGDRLYNHVYSQPLKTKLF